MTTEQKRHKLRSYIASDVASSTGSGGARIHWLRVASPRVGSVIVNQSLSEPVAYKRGEHQISPELNVERFYWHPTM